MRPEFNAHERRLYFTLTQFERTALAQFSNTKTRIYFILQLGYFNVYCVRKDIYEIIIGGSSSFLHAKSCFFLLTFYVFPVV
ncbi:DUF4158 domain-containing protein [Vibrio tapetis]|uniref:DUF4158 domain-containing protein n=1 Tax=Vibrio tapetis TaxID=52443 RepID=UPI001559D8E2